ncbi:hypothetical protein F2Q70_00035040 [Brassica cretica]|uniref:Uncharacterized protein n=1 Tax=Brassica cretica TaxID=69181 RepID=A0A8S9JNX2_BRACR|nr:hypothetical protein F2Q70_00035040 [Brassica cretica]KAF3528252.1 hypothetical protein DY000_02038224 [Brassica cretica]
MGIQERDRVSYSVRIVKMQTNKLFISIVSFLLYAPLMFSSPVPDPEAIVEEVHKY